MMVRNGTLSFASSLSLTLFFKWENYTLKSLRLLDLIMNKWASLIVSLLAAEIESLKHQKLC